MQIENKIREFIVKNLYYAEDNFIADDKSFLETGVIDSMGVMELVAFVQSEFGVEVAQNEIVVENFDSVRKLADFVRKKLLVQAPADSSQTKQNKSAPPPLPANEVAQFS